MSTQTNFIAKVKDGAISGMKTYGVLASLSIAQAILESGWGRSGLTAKANNLFGIKQNGWLLQNTVSSLTSEWENGKEVSCYARFRKYATWNASIEDHAKFLHDNARYHNLLNVTDYTKVCDLILQDGYATEPDYTALLIQLIKQYNLSQYDSVKVVPTKAVTKKKVIKGTWNVRSKPSTIGSKILRTIKIGDVYQILGTSGNWYDIGLNDKPVGWVSKSAFA